MKQKVKDKLEKRSTELLVLSAIIVVGGAVATASSSNILDAGASSSDGLVAEYRFDTEAGNTAYDTSGNNDGTINGATWISGVKGEGALNFDGNDYINAGSSSEVAFGGQSGITVSLWAKIKQGLGDDNKIVAKSSTFNFQPQYSSSSETKMRWEIHTESSGWTGCITEQGYTELDRWAHYTTTWNGSTAEIYKNGKLWKTCNIDGHFDPAGDSANLCIGGGFCGSDDVSADIDNVKIYSESLNHSQIKSLYNSGSWRIGTVTDKDDSSKVAEFSFQHQNSSHVLDTSGYNNHGERRNGVGQAGAVNCKIGRCYSFDGSNDYTEISNPPDITSSSENFTIMFWMKPDSTGNSNPVIEYDGGLHIWQYNSEDDFWLNPSGDCNGFEVTGGIELDKWNHYTATYDSADDEFRIYSDGRLLQTNSQNCSPYTSSTDLYFGHRDGDNRHFDGRLDQVKIFNRSLSQAEIIEKTQGLQGGGTVLDLRFNRDGGDKVHDYSGEKNHGTLQPNASTGPRRVDGLTGNALKFDGGNDYVDISSGSSAYDSDATTVLAWVKPDSGGWIAGDGARHRLNLDSSDATWWVRHNGGSSNQISGGDPKTNGWNLVVGTYDSDTGKQKLYLNGNLVESDTPNLELISGDDNQMIGGPYGNNAGFEGLIDNLKIYPYAISKSKVQQLYSRGKSHVGSSSSGSNSPTDLQKNLVLSQSFDHIETCGQSDTVSCPSGVNGKVAVDESDEANHGELMNDPSVKGAEDCRVSGCLGFDGSNDEVVLNQNEDFDFYSGDFVISAWIRKTTSNDFEQVVSKGSGSNTGQYTFGFWGSGENVQFNYGDQANIFSSNTAVNLDEWTHIAIEREGKKAIMYINGQKDSTDSNYFEGVSLNNSKKFRIGNRWEGPSSHLFEGSIDQVRVYNRSLSGQEVWKLYTQGRDREDGMAGAVGWWRFDDAAVYTENFIPNGDFTNGNDIPSEYGSNPTNKIVKMENPGNSDWVLRQNGSNTEYEIHFKDGTSPKANTTYVMSSWVAYTDNWDGDDQIFHARWYDSDGNSYTSGGSGHLIETKEVNGLTWEHRYETITTPNTVNGDFNWYWGWAASNTQGYRYLTNAQLEAKDYATEFVDGIREERVPDSAEDNNGQMGDSDTYDSGDPTVVNGKQGKALKFDGKDDYIEVSEQVMPSGDFTLCAWAEIEDPSTDRTIAGNVDTGSDTGAHLDVAQGDWKFLFEDGGNIAVRGTSAEAGEDKYLCGVYNSGTAVLYEDGKQTAKKTGINYDQPTSTNFRIGLESHGGWNNYWKGKIDDIRIYPYALNKEQVKKVMNGGAVSVG